jgi:hypothetical protein
VIGPRVGWITLVDLQARDAFPIFTTSENAQAYILEKLESDKLKVVTIKDPRILLGILDEIHRGSSTDTRGTARLAWWTE